MFYPGSAISQRALDSMMRCALADSLTHVAAVSADNLKVAEADLTGALSEIRAHRISPGVFGRYYDLVFAFRPSVTMTRKGSGARSYGWRASSRNSASCPTTRVHLARTRSAMPGC